MKANVMQKKDSMNAFDMILRNKSGDEQYKREANGMARHFVELHIYHELKTRDFISTTQASSSTHTTTT